MNKAVKFKKGVHATNTEDVFTAKGSVYIGSIEYTQADDVWEIGSPWQTVPADYQRRFKSKDAAVKQLLEYAEVWFWFKKRFLAVQEARGKFKQLKGV